MHNKTKFNKTLKKRFKLSRLYKGKGSILFIIVAVMSVLAILASAVYYSVSASRKQVDIRYDTEQAYQSAVSLNELFTDYLSVNSAGPLAQSIIGLAPGQSLVTTSSNADGFNEIAGGLGEYKITIKKIRGNGTSDEVHVLEIVTETKVNGKTESLSVVGAFTVTAQAASFDRFFTATGYAPNDVAITGGAINSTLYLDTEFSQIGTRPSAGANSDTHIAADIIAAGSVMFGRIPTFNKDATINNVTLERKEMNVTIGNNCYFVNNAELDLNGGKLRVGGSIVHLENCYPIKSNSDIYVLGDYFLGTAMSESNPSNIYIDGDLYLCGNADYPGKIYVNGDLIVSSEHNNSGIDNEIHVGGNVYIPSNMNVDSYRGGNVHIGGTSFVYEANDAASKAKMDFTLTEDSDVENYQRKGKELKAHFGQVPSHSLVWPLTGDSPSQVKAKINETIGYSEYINWDLENKFVSSTGALIIEPTVLDYTGADQWNPSTTKVFSAADQTEYVFDFQYLGHTGYGGINLVFDTANGTGGYEDIYVYLKANCKEVIEGNGGKKYVTNVPESEYDCFCWGPTDLKDSWAAMNVLVKGKGALVMVLPDNVKYVAKTASYVGHISLFEEAFNGGNPLDLNAAPPSAANCNSKIQIIQSLYTEDGYIKDNIITKYENNGEYIHNNVFLVTVSKNADMDFYSNSQNMFAGIIYAPYMTYKVKNANSMSVYVGGMVVGNYDIQASTNGYVFAAPYDYYDTHVSSGLNDEQKEEERKKYLSNLMASSGCSSTLGSSTSRSWRVYGYN